MTQHQGNILQQFHPSLLFDKLEYGHRIIKLFYCISKIMQKLGQIQLEKTVTVKVQCNLNDEIVVKNFKIIMDCLKDLSSSHSDLAGKFAKITDRVSSLQKNSNNSNGGGENNNQKEVIAEVKQKHESVAQPAASSGGVGMSEQQKQNLLNLIKQLDARTGQNQKNILDNIKDINLLNKEIQELKDQLGKLKSGNTNNTTNNNNNNITDNKEKDHSGLNMESINNINKEMQNNKQLISKTNEQLEKLRKQLANMKEKLNKIIDDHGKEIKNIQDNVEKGKGGDGQGQGNNAGGDLNRTELNELREKIAILNKKTNALQLLASDLKNETVSLGEGQEALQNNDMSLKKQIDELRQSLNNLLKNNKGGDKGNEKNSGNSKTDLDELRQIKNELKDLRSEIQELKREINNNNSKTSIDDEKRNKFERGNYTQVKFKDDSLKDIITRLQYLEKMLGSKNSISGDGDKLPLIKRNKVKERDSSIHDRSTSKKDVMQIKAELQAWLNNYMVEMKSKDNFDDIELKIQEIKNALNKKADQEGLRKGLSFLQAKINQLYLFLTEPDGDDAMIVRKGFNCLSCSKKVQKLRGKLGPHINWNNMTSTNYSPPKVGYSRHMGDNSAEKQDDQ